jgi:Rieske Fe-S protein
MNRRALVVVVIALGVVAIAIIGVVLLRSLQPTATARANNVAYVRVDNLAPGEVRSYLLSNGAPLLIYRPTPESLADLDVLNDHVWDPARRSYISALGVFVYLDRSSHLGCVLKEVPKSKATEYSPQWRGGLLENCGDASYDYAGRRIKTPEFALYGFSADLPNLVTPKVHVEQDGGLRVEM